MKLTLHTDYAIRVLVYVGLRGEALVTIREIADRYGISKNHLTKVVHELGRSGYLETVRGKCGGIRLLLRPESIRLGEFIRETEGDFALARCLRKDDDCDEKHCVIDATCLARRAFLEGLEAFFSTLNRYTLADMMAVEGTRNERVLAFA